MIGFCAFTLLRIPLKLPIGNPLVWVVGWSFVHLIKIIGRSLHFMTSKSWPPQPRPSTPMAFQLSALSPAQEVNSKVDSRVHSRTPPCFSGDIIWYPVKVLPIPWKQHCPARAVKHCGMVRMVIWMASKHFSTLYSSTWHRDVSPLEGLEAVPCPCNKWCLHLLKQRCGQHSLVRSLKLHDPSTMVMGTWDIRSMSICKCALMYSNCAVTCRDHQLHNIILPCDNPFMLDSHTCMWYFACTCRYCMACLIRSLACIEQCLEHVGARVNISQKYWRQQIHTRTPIYIDICISIYLSVCLSFIHFISFHSFIHLCLYLSLSIYVYLYLSLVYIYLFLSLSISIYLYLSLYLSI